MRAPKMVFDVVDTEKAVAVNDVVERRRDRNTDRRASPIHRRISGANAIAPLTIVRAVRSERSLA